MVEWIKYIKLKICILDVKKQDQNTIQEKNKVLFDVDAVVRLNSFRSKHYQSPAIHALNWENLITNKI